MAQSQWLFPTDALAHTPTVADGWAVDKELYDRSRGAELLYRLGSSLALPSSAMFTAATWFHRFYMRYSMQDYHRQEVAAACIFLATKTEECGRKLHDVAWVCTMKINYDQNLVRDHPDVERTKTAMLLAEEALLEALCFDFATESPHAELVDLCERDEAPAVHEYAWMLAHDTYRTPLCVLFPARVVAAGCYVLAQHLVDGVHSQSLDARLSPLPPSASLPTPPTHKPASPDAARIAIEHLQLSEAELRDVAETIVILLDFYKAHEQHKLEHLQVLRTITPPTVSANRLHLYATPWSELAPSTERPPAPVQAVEHSRTPSSTHGGASPAVTAEPARAKGWKPVKGSTDAAPAVRLDLS